MKLLQDDRVSLLRPGLHMAAAILIPILVTALDYKVFRVNGPTAGFSYLVVILALAARTGLRESIAASIVSVAAYNFYFFPPLGTFTVADPQNWVALCAFLLTAVIGSQLSSEAQRRAAEAHARQVELERMYDFSRGLLLAQEDESFAQHVTRQLVSSFALQNAWFFEANENRAADVRTHEQLPSFPALRTVAESGRPWHDPEAQIKAVPVRLGGSNLGSIALAGSSLPSAVALEATTHLIAIAMERSRAQQTAARLEAAREGEEIKSTLLDALAHEFKTPLTSIKAATSTLLSATLPAVEQQELVLIVDEEADRMTQLVTDSIELARLGTAPLILNTEAYRPEVLINSVLSDLRASLDGRHVSDEVSPSLPSIYVDRNSSELALRQILSNATKYSPSGSPIRIVAEAQPDSVAISITNEGIGIRPEDRERIFEKFHRGADVRHLIPGTGMGLTIARQIVEAQGGTVSLRTAERDAITFTLTFPVAPEEGLLSEGQLMEGA